MKHWMLLLLGIVTFCAMGLTVSSVMADDNRRDNATVSFGQWLTDQIPPLDRVTTPVPAAGAGNHHELIPNVATITITGDGAVNFIISGLHNPQVYDVGTEPGDISLENLLPGAGGGIINDANNRIYRGPDPNLPENPRDRVEVVRFSKLGTYLVICGVRNHFVNDGMFGFVRVIPDKPKK